MPQLKLVIDETSEGARMFFEPDYSMRSSINFPSQPNAMNFGGMDQRPNGSFFFEDVKKQEKGQFDSQVNFISQGCGTGNVNTQEKELSVRADTNEFGSQIQKDVKEVYCDGSIQTENKGSQMQVLGKEQEVNCQIIRPDLEE